MTPVAMRLRAMDSQSRPFQLKLWSPPGPVPPGRRSGPSGGVGLFSWFDISLVGWGESAPVVRLSRPSGQRKRQRTVSRRGSSPTMNAGHRLLSLGKSPIIWVWEPNPGKTTGLFHSPLPLLPAQHGRLAPSASGRPMVGHDGSRHGGQTVAFLPGSGGQPPGEGLRHITSALGFQEP